MEKFQYIPRIEAENLEKHKEDVEKQLMQLQLLFCDRIYQQYKKDCIKDGKPVEKTFSDILESEDVRSYYTEELRLLVRVASEKELSPDEEHDLAKTEYYDHLDDLYGALPDGDTDDNSPKFFKKRAEEIECLVGYLEDEKKKIKEHYPEKWREMTEKKKDESGKIKNRVGMIDFNPLKKHVNLDAVKTEEILKKEGFGEFDDFLEIHMPSAFEFEDKLNRDSVNASLSGLAEKIVNDMPETRAVVATSWLLDHPVLRRFIKMKIIGEGGGNWRQFIDKNGQLDQAKIEKLFSDGKLPFRNLIGYIEVKDFLSKYLPKEKRGEIKLKKIDYSLDPEKLNIEGLIKNESRAFGKAWDAGELNTEEKVRSCLEDMKIFKGTMEKLGVYERFENMMISNLGRSREEIIKENKEIFTKMENAYKDFIKEVNKGRYVDEIVRID